MTGHKRKTKAKRQPISASVLELRTSVRELSEQMVRWEVSIRSCLIQLAGCISKQQNVPELLELLAKQANEIAALRIRMGVRRAEYVREIAPVGQCETGDQNGTASASSATE